MRKLLPLILLSIFFTACSSDDYNTGSNNGGDNNNIVDEKIVGKWRVAYSQQISPAIYISDEQDLEEAKKKYFDSENFKIGVNELSDNPVVRAYYGNYGEPNVVPVCGMFDNQEVWIEIKSNKTIDVYQNRPESQLYPVSKVSVNIENNEIVYGSNPKFRISYYFDGSKLVLRLSKIEASYSLNIYKISEYTKIE